MKYSKSINAILLFLVLGLVALALPPQIARAATFTVDDDNPADYTTIQDAINAASTGDVITVYPGTYNENLAISDKEITLQSSDPNDPTATIINGGGTGRAVSFNNAGTSVLEGFTVTGGTDSGVYITSSSPTIMRCIFTSNTGSGGYGGGLYSQDSSPTIVNNIFYANTGDDLCLLYSTATVVNNTLYNTSGNGIRTLNGSATIANNIIYYQRDYGIYYYVMSGLAHFITIRHNLVSVRSSNEYYSPSGPFPVVVNDIKANPEFADPANANFHLQGTSPCINAGDNNMLPAGIDSDLEGNDRIADGIVDMGAYEQADSNAPAAPANLVATAGDKQVDLDWNDNTEIDLNGYNVYRSQTSGGAYTRVNGSLLSSSNYTDTGLTGGVTYYYVVTAVDLVNNESGYSIEASATPTDSTPPPAPTVENARMKKEAALEVLEEAKGEDNRLNRAIDRIQKLINTSLNDDWWQDGSRLDSRLGSRVFDRELVAALALETQSRLYDRLLPALERVIAVKENRDLDASREITRMQAIELALPCFEDALNNLALADQMLAGVALDDAEGTPVNNARFEKHYHRYLEMAEKYMDRANTSLDDGNSTRAIRYYKSAWNYAQQAIRFASRS